MNSVTFLLNDETVTTDQSRGTLVLDFVRRHRLTGTKEGCKEGDCGACNILVGTLQDDHIDYQVMTACLVPLGEMEGKHVVTIEGLNLSRLKSGPRRLSLVQERMVEFGGTQCGYCTPGFIVAMTWYLMASDDDEPNAEGMRRAMSGNLCRCTGYNSIERAGASVIDTLDEVHPEVWRAPDRIGAMVEEGLLPRAFSEAPTKLRAMAEQRAPDAVRAADLEPLFLAGGTDLYVQRGAEIPDLAVQLLTADDVAARHPNIRGIRVDADSIRIGAMTTFTEFAEHDAVKRLVPSIESWLWLIASLPIRNRATLGGNLVNASPIGDMTNLLLALGAVLRLSDGERDRDVPLQAFYLGYKTLDKRPSELVIEIVVPRESAATRTNFEKVSKRKALDIASVCSGARFEVEGETIEHAAISMGGVAAVPLVLAKTGTFLSGRKASTSVFTEALRVAQAEVSPISDVRGSATYKRLLVRQLMVAHFTELFGTVVDTRTLLTPPPEERHA